MTSPLSPEAVAQMVDVLNEQGPHHRRAADMLTTLAAENATLRAERAMLKFDIDKMLTQIEEHNAAWDELRASEAAALERVTELEALLAASTHSPRLPE